MELVPDSNPLAGPIRWTGSDGVRAYLGGISTQTLTKYIRDGELPAHRVGNRHRFNLDEIDAWLMQRGHARRDRDPSQSRWIDTAPGQAAS